MATQAYNRLLLNPWLIAVHCTSLVGDEEDARAVAGLARHLPKKRPPNRPRAHPGHGFRRRRPSTATGRPAQDSHEQLFFPLWPVPTARKDLAPRPKELSRLDYLADAKAACTVFRLHRSAFCSGVPGVPCSPTAPDFPPGERVNVCPGDHIQLGVYEDGGLATMYPVQGDNSCTLITRFTGSGKADHRTPLVAPALGESESSGAVLGSPNRPSRSTTGSSAYQSSRTTCAFTYRERDGRSRSGSARLSCCPGSGSRHTSVGSRAVASKEADTTGRSVLVGDCRGSRRGVCAVWLDHHRYVPERHAASPPVSDAGRVRQNGEAGHRKSVVCGRK